MAKRPSDSEKKKKKYIFGSGKLQDQTLLDLDQELFVRSF